VSDDLTIYIGADGTVQHVYDDALAELLVDDGEVTTHRASHVEPHPRGGWIADMRPVGGPILGADGAIVGDLNGDDAYAIAVAALDSFRLRAEALAAERAWLDACLADGSLPCR
jgi:hypothetical protein